MGVVTIFLASVPAEAATAPAMRFGMDRGSIDKQIGLGIKPDYAQFWAGAWNLESGFGYLRDWTDQIADRGVVPVVEWFYWGNDIGKSCVTNGCWSDIHNTWKDMEKWKSGARQLADALHQGLQGRRAIVVIETEFNKGGVQTWESFDGYLVEQANIFRNRAPEVKLALGFGNWAPQYWGTFDRAVAAMDKVGFQTMRGSTRESYSTYVNTVDAIKNGAQNLKNRFGKPVLLHDLALSSFWEPDYGWHQETVIKRLFTRLGELKSAGLEGIVYRAMGDNPGATTKEYYGEAEKYWGLVRSSGSWKPATDDWVAGVKAERSGTSYSGGTSSGSTSSGSTFSATFNPLSENNNWWVEVDITSASTLTKVEARVNSGPWIYLPETDYDTWAKSISAPDGSEVQFRAWNTAGAYALSRQYSWGDAVSDGGSFAADFTPTSVKNNWYVEVDVVSDRTISKVEARVNGGSWVHLPKTDYATRTYAKSMYVADGADVQFRAWNGAGDAAWSDLYEWGDAQFTASFRPEQTENNYWVEVDVSSGSPISKVEVQLNDGSWQLMDERDYGWVKSVSVPYGTQVQFRAWNGAGATAYSPTYTWR